MKALTVRQPWADMIIYGDKTTENRTRSTRYRGPLAIHAGKQIDKEAAGLYCHNHDVEDHERGAIIGTVDVVGCHHASECSGCGWGQPDCWHWELANPRPLPVPWPVNGRLGLWEWDEREGQA